MIDPALFAKLIQSLYTFTDLGTGLTRVINVAGQIVYDQIKLMIIETLPCGMAQHKYLNSLLDTIIRSQG